MCQLVASWGSVGREGMQLVIGDRTDTFRILLGFGSDGRGVY